MLEEYKDGFKKFAGMVNAGFISCAFNYFIFAALYKVMKVCEKRMHIIMHPACMLVVSIIIAK